jgi:omega-amidase
LRAATSIEHLAHRDLHIDEQGELAGQVDKTGLTVAEATFFHGGRGRPVAVLQGRKVSAVMCREIEDLALVKHHLPPGAAELIFWPGLIGTSPEPDSNDVGEDAKRLARQQTAWLIQNNWPRSLNLPEDDPRQAELGGSRVIAPSGELMLRLPMRVAGLATFDLGAAAFTWDALAVPALPT